MGLRDSFLSLFSFGQHEVQARAAAPFEVNIPGLFPTRYPQGQYRYPSVREALGVPAILRCVTLIANTAGALSMNGIQNGVTVAAQDRPRIIVRPNPLTTPRVFWRDSAFWKATRGEQWWWVAKRDGDGLAMSLVPVPPYEVRVEEDPSDLRYPVIWWRDRKMPRGDMILDTLLPDPDHPFRGVGPLQLCGAAVSAAVEAESWAASFYSEGGFPSVWAKPEVPFADEDEATKFKQKWTSNPPNTPLVIEGIEEVGTLPVDQASAQMLDARTFTFGQAALMFGLPGSMVEYVQSGSSLTYQNVGQRFDDFVKGCLWPNYLEGSEQAMTDLLARSWVAEFDTDRFTRPDPKTRMEIHKIAIEAGVYDPEYAQRQEGIRPGSIETAPIPPSPPQAIPAPIEARAAHELRCDGMTSKRRSGVSRIERCNRLLSKTGDFVGTCPRCKKVYAAVAA
jgi:HK97 family phage portal protein